MDEKVSATDKCYRARGCLLKFRAHCETTERSVNMRSCQAARARRARAQKPSAIRPDNSVRNLPENPYSNRESLFE